jgi:hypothetical protein
MIDSVSNNPNSNLGKRRSIFIIISIGFGFIALLLALKLAPWFYAINTHVRLYLSAPAETKISICWDEEQTQCLPFVPYSTTENKIAQPGKVADMWLSELPPRPEYSISIQFDSDVYKAVFHELELDSSKVLLFGYTPGIGINNLRLGMNQFDLQGVSYTLINGSNYFGSKIGGQLTLIRKIIPGPSIEPRGEMTTMLVWGLLISVYLLLAIPMYLLPHVIMHLESRNNSGYLPKYSWWMYVLAGAALVLMPLLVKNSGVILNEYDPMGYLYLVQSGEWFSDARLPGYPLFLGSALRFFRYILGHYSLSGVIFLQAVILAFSVTICTWTLRRWISPYIAIIFVFLCLFSPAQVHWARWILRESLFASLVLLGVTAAIAHFTSGKPVSYLCLFVFAIICGLSFLVRENGLLLPVALFPVLIPEIIKRLLGSDTLWKRAQSIFLITTPYLIPIVIIGIIYAAFSSYNYEHYGYFQVGIHQTSHSSLIKAIYPANSDARSLLNPGSTVSEEAKLYHGWPLYSSYILARDQVPRLDPIYVSLYPSVSHVMSERGEPANSFHIASILYQIGNGMNKLVPWQADISGVLRQYKEIISLSNSHFYTFQVVDSTTLANSQKLLDQFSKNPRIQIPAKIAEPDSIVATYYKVTQGYGWYDVLYILAGLSSLYILRYENPAFLAPIAVFSANAALLLITRLVSYRYLVSLDILLILQMTLGLSCWINRYYYSKRSSKQ